MIYRIILSLTKLKVLNFLLVFFMVLSFVGIATSSYYTYKIFDYNKNINLDDSYNIVSTSDIINRDFIGEDYFKEKGSFIKSFKESLDNKDIDDAKLANIYSNLMFKEISGTVFEKDGVSYDVNVEMSFGNECKNCGYTIDAEYEDDKVYVDKSIMDIAGLNVGDKLTISVYENDFGMYLGSDPKTIPLLEVEIGGTLSFDNEEYGDVQVFGGPEDREMMFGYINIPVEILFSLDETEYTVYDGTYVMYGDSGKMQDLKTKLTNEYSDLHVYNSDDEIEGFLSSFKSIKNTFIILFVVSILIFAITFSAINNSIFEKRKNELQLFNIFGAVISTIRIQFILEKIALLVISMIVAIPAVLYVLRVSNNVINKIVSFYLGDVSPVEQIVQYTSSNQEAFNYSLLYSGLAEITVNNWLIILFSLLLMITLIVTLTLLQVSIFKKTIIEYRRGE